jgi:hypothetical protein
METSLENFVFIFTQCFHYILYYKHFPSYYLLKFLICKPKCRKSQSLVEKKSCFHLMKRKVNNYTGVADDVFELTVKHLTSYAKVTVVSDAYINIYHICLKSYIRSKVHTSMLRGAFLPRHISSSRWRRHPPDMEDT